MQAIRSRDSRCLHHENLHLPMEQLRMWMRNHHGRARLCKHLEAALQWALLCPWWVPWGVGMVVGRRSLRNPTVTCNQIVFLNRGRGCFAAREVSCGGTQAGSSFGSQWPICWLSDSSHARMFGGGSEMSEGQPHITLAARPILKWQRISGRRGMEGIDVCERRFSFPSCV